jgi:predicted DsbA family dithiol-disulfide isomerase
MALENQLIQAEMVEATEFPDLADRHGVHGVPHTTINDGKAHVVGAVPEANLLAEIQKVLS